MSSTSQDRKSNHADELVHMFLLGLGLVRINDGGTLVFLTNDLTFGATTMAAIYQDRWQIELFFKALKQNLKINGSD